MRVLLIQSYLGNKEYPVYPLGLSYLAASLSEHEVRLLDLNTVCGDVLARLKEDVTEFNPQVVGVSLRNIDSTHTLEVVFYYQHLSPILKAIRETKPEVKIIVGGAGFSIFAQEIMARESEIDYGVFLEGEETLPNLLANLTTPERVKGIYYRKNDQQQEICFTGSPDSLNFEALPAPVWDRLDMTPYVEYSDGVGIQSKRGCVLNCAYCTYPFLNGNQLRLRSPQKVVDEIQLLVEKYHLRSFIFVDSVFNIPLDHAEQICHEIIRRGFKVEWEAWFNEKNTSREFFRLAHQAGCTTFTFSPDGFSPRTLQVLQKNITVEDVLRVIDEISDLEGIKVHFNFFLNPPGQNLWGLGRIFWLRRKIKRIFGRRLRNFGLLSLRIEPHTHLQKLAMKQGLIDKENKLLFPVYYQNPDWPSIDHIFGILVKGKRAFNNLFRVS